MTVILVAVVVLCSMSMAVSKRPRSNKATALVPGTYRVRVESWKRPPAMGKPGISNVPKDFQAEDLVVSAEEKSIEYNLELNPQ